MTDYKQLCAELLQELESSHDDVGLINNRRISLINRTRAALAEPQPEGPSGDEIYKLALEGDFLVDVGDGFTCMVQDEVEFARAVLARWNSY